jgi:hypothetical protein
MKVHTLRCSDFRIYCAHTEFYEMYIYVDRKRRIVVFHFIYCLQLDPRGRQIIHLVDLHCHLGRNKLGFRSNFMWERSSSKKLLRMRLLWLHICSNHTHCQLLICYFQEDEFHVKESAGYKNSACGD